MRTAVRTGLISIALILVAGSAPAQDLEIFELDDFIDPIELSTTLSGDPMEKPLTFFSSRVLAGSDYNYQYRNQFTESSVDFIRMANRLYFSRFQANAKATFLRARDCDGRVGCGAVPDFKGRLQFGVYSTGRDSTSKSPGRYQFSWGVEHSEAAGFVHEFSYEVDILMYRLFPESLQLRSFGGFNWSWKPDENTHYLGMGYRYTIFQWGNGSNLELAYGFNGAHNDKWKWGALRFQMSTDFVILPRSTSIQLTYAISRDMSRSNSWNHELGAFVNASVFTLLK